MREIEVRLESFPTKGEFRIARGAVRAVDLVTVTIGEDGHTGCGECRPYARYGETPELVRERILAVAVRVCDGLDRLALMGVLPPGAARNAIDCALWDLEAKRTGRAVHELAGLSRPASLLTAFTLSLAAPDAMAKAAAAASDYPLLKLKLGAAGDELRLRAVRAARPDARLIVDANEGWELARLEAMFDAAAAAAVELIEQPLPAGQDEALAAVTRLVPVCADESAHASDGLAALVGRYDAVNIKLDKTGGLTEALVMARSARALGLKLMAGCMVATSLAMAPALLIGGLADWVDLDGPLLLAADREGGLVYEGAWVQPAPATLWGGSLARAP